MKERLGTAFWWLVFIAHALGALAWWWMMPHGFPPSHGRFFLNELLPWLVVAMAVAHGVPQLPARYRVALRCTLGLTWMIAAWVAHDTFPVTVSSRWPLAFGGGVVLLGISLVGPHRRAIFLAIIPAFVLGVAPILALRGPDASTHPRSVALPPRLAEMALFESAPIVGTAEVQIAARTISVSSGARSLHLDPMLTFISRSPDRAWTVFAPEQDRVGPTTMQRGVTSEDNVLRADYLGGDEASTLEVRADGTALGITALSQLPRAVWSHLNSFTQMTLVGHRTLFVSFSPAPDVRIELKDSDYPSGRPARFAYVDAARRFHAVEASDAEKGPFTDLASGPLATDAPLTLTFYDGETPTFRVTLDDFAAQASTELSPTAGWRVPQNAIEFVLDGQLGFISITLAGTGVGRGFDSVGHAAGVYRNRMRIETL